MINPIVHSLRGIQQASRLRKVQTRLGCPRTSLGSQSEAIEVFDPERLEGIIGALLRDVPKTRGKRDIVSLRSERAANPSLRAVVVSGC